MKVLGVLAAAVIVGILVVLQLSPSGGGGSQAKHAREAAQETAAIAALRALAAAETQVKMRSGSYGDLAALARAGAIDPVLASGKKAGYLFRVTEAGEDRWRAIAVPEFPGHSGERSFYADETGVLRFTADGAEPGPESPPLCGM
jgi:hypothetical protein